MNNEEAVEDLLTRKEYLAFLSKEERKIVSAYKTMLKRGKLPKNMNKLLERHGYKIETKVSWKRPEK
jgi:hypothetical protein